VPRGQFWIEFNDFLAHFNSTCILVDGPSRSHYKISSAGVSLKNKNDFFFKFSLSESIDCHKNILGIICEQQGNRIVTANLPDSCS